MENTKSFLKLKELQDTRYSKTQGTQDSRTNKNLKKQGT